MSYDKKKLLKVDANAMNEFCCLRWDYESKQFANRDQPFN